MATLTIDVPNPIAVRVNNAFAKRHGYQETVTQEDGTTIPNPQTKQQFLKQKVIQFILDSARSQEQSEAAEAAATRANSEIVLT